MDFPGDMQGMLQKAQEMQQKMAQIQDELKSKTVSASAGGGMVTVTVTGGQEVKAVKIEQEVIKEGDAEMLEDLVLAATNEAMRKSKDMMKSELTKLTGGIPIPGFTS